MPVHLSMPSVLQYTDFVDGVATPLVHVFARGEDGQLYVRSGHVVGLQMQGDWIGLGLTPSGAQVSSQPVGTVAYVDEAGVRQAHAFVVGQDNQLSALSLNLGGWEWRKLPAPPAGHKIISPATVVPFFFDGSTRINAFVSVSRSDGLGRLLAYVFDGRQEVWVDFPQPQASNDLSFVFQFGASIFDSVNLTSLYAVITGTLSQKSYLLTWDGSTTQFSKKEWTTLTDGRPPAHLFSVYSTLVKSAIPVLGTQRLAAFVVGGQAATNLFACVSDDGTKWIWQDQGNDRSGRTSRGELGTFSYIRVTPTPTGRFFSSVFVTAILYGDGSLAVNAWDGNKSTWANLGSPPSGATGLPCGAGFYVGPEDQAIETMIVVTASVDGGLFVNQPGVFGREWRSLGSPASPQPIPKLTGESTRVVY